MCAGSCRARGPGIDRDIEMNALSEAESLRQKVETRLGTTIADLRFFATGLNANLYVVDIDQDRRLMAKTAHRPEAGLMSLEVEGWMLDYLSRKSDLPVPKVHWYDGSTILMDYIQDSGMLDDDVQANAAELLAGLHSIRADFFGLERDSALASFEQPNPFEMSWITFFRDYRLLHAARAALEGGAIDAVLMARIEKLAAKLGSYINNRATPSLVHGDLWGGNVLFGSGRVNAFLDPAIYYADPEVELAGIALFGTFGEEFFNCYHDMRPISAEFHDTVKDIYTLYPLLTCARMGNRALVKRIAEIVERYAG